MGPEPEHVTYFVLPFDVHYFVKAVKKETVKLLSCLEYNDHVSGL